VSPALHRLIRRRNLFRNCAAKCLTDLPSTGYSPAKKKEVSCTHGIGISPCDADDASDSNKDEDEDYSPAPTYKIVQTTQQKKQDAKITLESSYFAFLCPTTFDTKQFCRGHPPVYSEEEMVQFDSNFQKQLLFNFSATRATWKKSASMYEGCASCLHEVDLNIAPTTLLNSCILIRESALLRLERKMG
jgi:hypothetical protein